MSVRDYMQSVRPLPLSTPYVVAMHGMERKATIKQLSTAVPLIALLIVIDSILHQDHAI